MHYSHTMCRAIFSIIGVSIAITLLACVGCGAGVWGGVGGWGGPRNFVNDNDRLRRSNLELQQQVHELQTAIQQRVATIDALEQKIHHQTNQTNIDVDIDPAQAPQLTRVTFGRYSGMIDTNDDGRDDTLRLYIQTLDQDGRFYPARATAVLQAIVITPDAAPQQLFKQTYNAKQFAQAYRSGFTGTHFTFKIAPPDPDALPDSFTVQISITDHSTNITANQQMVVRVKH